MPRRSNISGARFTCSPLLASRLPQCIMVHVRQPYLLCIASLLNRRYLQVSGSVRVGRGIVGRLGLGLGLVLSVTARARVSPRVTVRDRDRI